MNLFIDTSIYLTFYHFAKDDLEELRKIIAALESRKINLLLPQQTIDEYRRNREAKISDALNKFTNQKIPNQFPQICKNYPEYKEILDKLEKFEHLKNQLLTKLYKDINNNALEADLIILDIFKHANIIETNKMILEEAKNRYDLRNPPGKNNSYGDAVNWISLLKKAPDNEDLHIVVRDKDYCSAIDDSTISQFLYNEWTDKKESKIYLYTSLSSFFIKHFPKIKLATEMKKNFLINDLMTSSNFRKSHTIVRELSNYTDFTDKEVNDIVEAYITNDQVYQIIEDSEIMEFILYILKDREKIIPDENLLIIKSRLDNISS